MEQFSALLVCSDRGVISTVQRVLDGYSFNLKVIAAPQAADQAIRSNKFDLAIYDNDVEGAIQLASSTSTSAPKMVFALMRYAAMADAHRKPVHFILQKPFTADLFTRSMKAAFGTMLRQKRQALRHTVEIIPSSCVSVGDGNEKALGDPIILDISQTGLCLRIRELLTQGARVHVSFQLPETTCTISVRGIVMWVQASGRTGVKFARVEAEDQKALNDWLNSRLSYAAEVLPRTTLAGVH